MGTYISHLRNAAILINEIKDLDEEFFLIGNFAPDCGIPNKDGTLFDPPREITHSLRWGEEEGRIKDLDFYQQYISPMEWQKNPRCYSFLLGYFIHLLCDNLWSLWIVEACKRDYEAMLRVNEAEGWKMLKMDWHDLDRKYVREHEDSDIWRALMAVTIVPDCLPYLPAEAIKQQIEYIRKIYTKPDAGRGLERRYPYFNEATMRRFVEESTDVALEILSQKDKLAGLRDTHTALSLLPPEKVQPYPPPIGDAT